MRTTRIALLVLLLLGTAGGAGFASTSVGVSLHSDEVDLGFFYDDLAPYGNWVETPRYGWVWTPVAVADTWRPYEDGHWVWTDQGWLWVSDEPFGWATYHYGRWYDDPSLGWAWVPGYAWAPSWVSFQEGPDYIGWAPLPPSVSLVSGFNGARLSLSIGAGSYVFVPDRYFLAPSLATYVVPAPRVLPIYHRSRNVTSYRFDRGRVFCEGVRASRFDRFHRGGVRRARIADFGPDLRRRGARFRGDRIEVFRPQVRRARVDPPSLRPAARRSALTLSEFRATRGRRFDRATRGLAKPGRAEFRSVEDRRREVRLDRRNQTRTRDVTRERSKVVRRAERPSREITRQRSREIVRRPTPPSRQVTRERSKEVRRLERPTSREITRQRSREVVRRSTPAAREVTRQRTREVRRISPPVREVRRSREVIRRSTPAAREVTRQRTREVRRVSPPVREVRRSREVRPPRVRSESLRSRSEVRIQRQRSEPRIHNVRSESRVRRVERARPAPRMRERSSARQTERRVHQAPRQQRQDRAARREGRQHRNRPPR